MAPLPKKKTSVSRKKRRRSALRATVTRLVACPQCRSPKPSHRACPICGTYRGREVLHIGRDHRPREVGQQ